MKRILALAFAALTFSSWGFTACHLFETNSTPLGRKFHTYFAKTEAMIPMPNYVTNGLTHWYDGQMNVGLGWHKDGDIAFWKDLAGDNDLLITSTNIYFTKKGLRCPQYKVNAGQWGTRTAGLARGEQIPDSECVTIEVCARSRRYYNGTYTDAHISTDQYNILVSNGRNNSSYPTHYPHFIGFHSNAGTTQRFYGGPYFVIGGRNNCGIRCQSYDSDYGIWGGGLYAIYPMFYLAYINSNTSETSPSSPYYQPYWTAKIDYTRFAPTFETCINTFSDEAPKYNSAGQLRNSTLLKPDPNFNYFSIGGSCYGEYVFGRDVFYDTNFWNGDIFCVRVYNRELTAEERAQNSKIDYERFYERY